MVATGVVTGTCALFPVAGVTVAGNVTVTAVDQSAQQIRIGCGAARAQPPVLVGDVVDTIECVTIDDRRNGIAIHSSRGRSRWRVIRPRVSPWIRSLRL